jgi:NADPH:quinone reductase-like Zn-dependent oxidoreductase
MTDTMRAIVLDAPGPPDALTIRELPVPTPASGWVVIEVKAFGLNRSEVHTRQGLASGVTSRASSVSKLPGWSPNALAASSRSANRSPP